MRRQAFTMLCAAVLACPALLATAESEPAFARAATAASEPGFAPAASTAPLDEPFRGITTDGDVRDGLFGIRATGVSTAPVREAAIAFLDGLTDAQRRASHFPVDDDQWRRWDNRSRALREGTAFQDMTDAQREHAFALLRASLSAQGLTTTRDIMRLNETIAEITGNWAAYGEWRYYLTVMGLPSETEPWGWQLNGHHLIVNYFVLGDQVVMTPTFMGSEPVIAEAGKYEGTAVLQAEQDQGLAMMQALDASQQTQARIASEKGPANNLTEAYRDNVVLDYAGISATALDAAQRQRLLDLIGLYVANIREDHARVRMSEVEAHLDETHFGWIGETTPDAVFYYRIHSPVILIEFDHQRPIALDRTGAPSRQHVHTVVRTPNAGDYGKDLLRQHHEQGHHQGAQGHHHGAHAQHDGGHAQHDREHGQHHGGHHHAVGQ